MREWKKWKRKQKRRRRWTEEECVDGEGGNVRREGGRRE